MNKQVLGHVGLVFVARGNDLQVGWYNVGLSVIII
jgi:hypothetical protein